LHRFSADRRPPPPIFDEEILRLQTQRGEHVVEGAPCEAVQQDTAVVPLPDTKARIPILVGRTGGHEVTVVRLDAFQALQDAIYGPHTAPVWGFELVYTRDISFPGLRGFPWSVVARPFRLCRHTSIATLL
jgi:hypothetical protein